MKNNSTFIFLMLIAIVGVFTLDVYLPGMPAMADQFGVSLQEITYTFTGFSVVFAITQLFHGTISDFIGRKPVVMIGLAVAAVATLICAYSENYITLFAARILQAMGISSFVVVNAIIRDLYAGTRAVQIRTMVATASGISLSIAPTIGGLLQEKFGWQGGFIVSLILIVVTLIFAIIFFKESHLNRMNNDRRIIQIVNSYFDLFNNSNYLRHVFMAMLAYTVHFSFIILSSSIFINILGATPLVFGYLMIVYGGVYFVSGLLSNWIAKKLTIPSLINLGSTLIGIGGLLMLILLMTVTTGSWQILAPMSVITMGVTVVRASAITGALAPIPAQAGIGAAGLNLVQFTISALIATGISALSTNPQLSLSILAIISAFSIRYLIKRVEK